MCFSLAGKSTLARSTAFTECFISAPSFTFKSIILGISIGYSPPSFTLSFFFSLVFFFFSLWSDEEISGEMLWPLQHLLPRHLSPWVRLGPRQSPTPSSPPRLAGKGCCVELPFPSSYIADNQLGSSSYLPSTFLNWNHWMFPCHSSSTSLSSDQSELEADTQTLTDQHLVLTPKPIYFLSYSISLILEGGLLSCPHMTIPFDLSHWASTWFPHCSIVYWLEFAQPRIFPAMTRSKPVVWYSQAYWSNPRKETASEQTWASQQQRKRQNYDRVLGKGGI